MKKDQALSLLQTKPESSSVHYKSGLWYRTRGMDAAALSCFEKALSITRSGEKTADPSFDESLCWMEYGRLLRQLGRHHEAGMAFRECLARKRHIPEALAEIGLLLRSVGNKRRGSPDPVNRGRLRIHRRSGASCSGNALGAGSLCFRCRTLCIPKPS